MKFFKTITLLLWLLPAAALAQPEGSTMPSRGVRDTLHLTYEMLAGTSIPKTYEGMRKRPVFVQYYIPNLSDVSNLPILIAMSGAERSGSAQMNVWQRFAEQYGIIVLTPQFFRKKDLEKLPENVRPIYTTGNYWGSNRYQLGNVATGTIVEGGDKKLRPRSQWTYGIIEALFDYVKMQIGSNAEGYYLFGHSAGGQFVGRMAMVYPEARIIRAVAASPSSWAWPAIDGFKGNDGKIYGWPYSIKDIYKDYKELAPCFEKDLYIMVGSLDTKTAALDMSPTAMAQGDRRTDRAANFYSACKKVAKKNKLKFNFKFAEVEGVGHGTKGIAFGGPDSRSVLLEDLGPNAAFRILFEDVITGKAAANAGKEKKTKKAKK